MSESTRCWQCLGKLVGPGGVAKPPYFFAVVLDPIGNEVRVHKVCAKNAGLKTVTAPPAERPEPA